MPRLHDTPIPQLTVPNQDWLHVLVSLVAHAETIIMFVTDWSDGVAAELRCIQMQAREDSTIIVVPTEEAIREDRQVVDMWLLEKRADPLPPLAMDHDALTSVLAGFGLVLTRDEFAGILDFIGAGAGDAADGGDPPISSRRDDR